MESNNLAKLMVAIILIMTVGPLIIFGFTIGIPIYTEVAASNLSY